MDTETGAEQVSEIRTSSGMFFERGENEVIRRKCPYNSIPPGLNRTHLFLGMAELVNSI